MKIKICFSPFFNCFCFYFFITSTNVGSYT